MGCCIDALLPGALHSLEDYLSDLSVQIPSSSLIAASCINVTNNEWAVQSDTYIYMHNPDTDTAKWQTIRNFGRALESTGEIDRAFTPRKVQNRGILSICRKGHHPHKGELLLALSFSGTFPTCTIFVIPPVAPFLFICMMIPPAGHQNLMIVLDCQEVLRRQLANC